MNRCEFIVNFRREMSAVPFVWMDSADLDCYAVDVFARLPGKIKLDSRGIGESVQRLTKGCFHTAADYSADRNSKTQRNFLDQWPFGSGEPRGNH